MSNSQTEIKGQFKFNESNNNQELDKSNPSNGLNVTTNMGIEIIFFMFYKTLIKRKKE